MEINILVLISVAITCMILGMTIGCFIFDKEIKRLEDKNKVLEYENEKLKNEFVREVIFSSANVTASETASVTASENESPSGTAKTQKEVNEETLRATLLEIEKLNEKELNALFGLEAQDESERNRSEKEKLEKRLAEINFKEKYPLCADIKENKCEFIEFYVNGKSIGKWTKDGAFDYAKKSLKQTDWKLLSQWGIRDSAYEVVKKPSKK